MSSSKMSQNLLKTLDALEAKDNVIQSTPLPGFEPGKDYDPDTGEWTGDPPAGYEPMVAPEIRVETRESKAPDFSNSDARTDYVRIRDTTYAMQEATLHMMGEAAKLAANTEAPRAFSVFRELGELMRGLNKDLMENLKTYKTVTVGDDPSTDNETNVTVKTNEDGSTEVRVGQKRSSRDLLKAIREAKRTLNDREAEEATDVEGEVVEKTESQPEAQPETPVEETADGVPEA
ncbi:terminase small subunit [Serratia phage vB_SmaA_3M]|uniref:Putative terminase DNA packaging enzyme small subunit n=1 Tax=Serratia phage vB_SmaA_3M TaxID=2419930 RepID=A0A3G2YS42_9CAUD|nr:terminase small subunit [Serratia phage vB_SmaA_3M]AYP28308.1 putative terminase DNA packaging enzyme small subunit [Serratia phage vB_SmaA_3M]